MKKSSRPNFKNKQLILENRQRRSFLPISVAFAPVAADLIGKIIGRGKRKKPQKNKKTKKKQIKFNYPKIKFTKNKRRR